MSKSIIRGIKTNPAEEEMHKILKLKIEGNINA